MPKADLPAGLLAGLREALGNSSLLLNVVDVASLGRRAKPCGERARRETSEPPP
jgi:hypothetical protein